MLKISPPWKGGKGDWTAEVSATVNVEPWDGVEGCFGALTDVQHVDSRRELVVDLVGGRIDVSHLVGEFAL